MHPTSDVKHTRVVRADEQGFLHLHLDLPLGVPGGEFEVTVRDANASRTVGAEWPADYFQRVVGCMENDPSFTLPPRAAVRPPPDLDV
jgi:hypothetical protein